MIKVYILTIELQNNEATIEYKVVEGLFADKETAKSEAINRIRMQQSMWDGSYIKKLGMGKVALIDKDGYSKIYCIREMEVK